MSNPLHLPAPELLLRIALAFSFAYPALAAVFDPYAWIGYLPAVASTLAPGMEMLLLQIWGLVEIALALWVLFASRVFIPSTLMMLGLLAVVVANPGQFPILFRDLSIALAGAALVWMHRPHA